MQNSGPGLLAQVVGNVAGKSVTRTVQEAEWTKQTGASSGATWQCGSWTVLVLIET